MVNDLGFGVRAHVEPSLRVVSLTDNVAVLTALANDVGYGQVFLRQLQLYFRPGDKLIVISASGNSPNLIVAAEWVRKQGGKVIGFLGFDGGKLKHICDIPLVVVTAKGDYGPVEDVHMILDHLVNTWLWGKIRREVGV
jgi:D-sedoheptulose 7-phosphate isomerase